MNDSVKKISLPESKSSTGVLEQIDAKGERIFVYTPRGVLEPTWLISILICWAGFGGVLAATNISWFPGAILGLFGVCFSVAVVALVNFNQGFRSTTFRVQKGVLQVEKRFIFWTATDVIPESEILAIQVALKSVDDNKNFSRLKIWRVNGEPVELLHELDEPRLHWLEFELNRELGRLPRDLSQNWKLALKEKQWPEPPEESEIRIRVNTPKRRSILIPPMGLSSGWSLRLVGISFLIVGLLVFLLNDAEPVIYLTVAFFGVVGLVLTVASFEYSFRWFEIEVDQEQCKITRHGLIGRKTFQWPMELIKTIDLKNTERNLDFPMLSIETKTRTTFRMMLGRTPAEILFVAAHLNELIPLPR